MNVEAPASSEARLQSDAGGFAAGIDRDNDWLVIASGMQAGARTPLVFSQPVLFGTGRDNDIVLRDPGAGLSRVRLTPRAEGIQLQVLDGIVVVDGEIFTVEQQLMLGSGKRFAMDEVECLIDVDTPGERPIEKPESSEGGAFDLQGRRASLFDGDLSDLAAPELVGPANSTAVQPLEAQLPPPTSQWYRSGSALIALMLLLGGVGLWLRGAMTPPQMPRASMSAMLESTSMSGLVVKEQDGSVQLSGYLESLDDAAELDQLIELSGYQVDNQVLIGERVSTQVSDIFRVNNVPAEVTVSEDGSVTIITRVPDEKLLQHVENLVLEDVPGIATVEIDNIPPPVEDAGEGSAPMDPGKRVAMVVSDTPAYIVTEDKSRYFVGSLLPSGHRIASIDQGTVMLEKKGVKTLLEF